MSRYPIKMLKDEEGIPFVPLVSTEALRTPEGETIEEKLEKKLEPSNLIAGKNITLSVDGNNVTINNASKGVLIDNLTTEQSGIGALDAHQGYLLNHKVVPAGGTTGQVLKKSSNDDHALEWGDAADPNAIVGDGSIKKIIELTYEEYQALETIDPDTEYHIIDAQSSVDNLADFIESIILETDKRKHPIGSLEFNVSGTNPSVYLGFGTWELWGAGRVPVGVDVTQDEFNTAEKTGGSKYLQKHSHSGSTGIGKTKFLRHVGAVGTGHEHNHTVGYDSSGYVDVTDGSFNGANHYHDFTTDETGTGNGGNLQPYITCYMWKRVL